MKVLHLVKTAVGASWAVRQMRELVRQGIEVHVAMPCGPMRQAYKRVGVKCHRLSPELAPLRPHETLHRANALSRLVETVSPDIVHSHFVSSTLLMRLALRNKRIPRIFHIPGPLHLEHNLYRAIDIKTANRDDYYLASCKWTQNALMRFGMEENRVGLAYYGVTANDFQKKEVTRTVNLRTLINANNDDFIIGMVAYFYAPKRFLGQKRGLKGHEDLIDAIALVRKKYKNLRCVFIGGPWGKANQYFESVKHYAAERLGDHCSFLGTRKDVPALYPQIDLAVHPSHSENVGGAVESLYSQVPTLTTNVGGFPDLIEQGVTGLMAEAKNPHSLAEQIEYAYTNRPEMVLMAQRGLEKVSKIMDVSKNGLEVSSFYEHVIKHHREALYEKAS